MASRREQVLAALFGDPVTVQTKAADHIAFSGQPAANSTITLNGVTWTFVTETHVGIQTQIGANIDSTLTAVASDLNGSADAQISKCTYTANTADDRLEIEFDTAGTTGNAFTRAASGKQAKKWQRSARSPCRPCRPSRRLASAAASSPAFRRPCTPS